MRAPRAPPVAVAEIDPFFAWLLTIARRNLQDTIRLLAADKRGGNVRRVESRDPNESYDGLLGMLAESTATPSRHAARKEIVAALERAIDALPEDHRRTVRMYDLEDRSVASIAKELGRTPGAVYMLRARAIDAHNADPKPLVWTAEVKDILPKIARAQAALDTVVNQ